MCENPAAADSGDLNIVWHRFLLEFWTITKLFGMPDSRRSSLHLSVHSTPPALPGLRVTAGFAGLG